jgi:hypothetical protein
MANHQVTHKWEKSGGSFNSVQEAIEAHLADASNSPETTLTEHETWTAGQTDFTETKELASGGEPVAAGTAGNGYRLIRTFTEAKYIAHKAAEEAANASYPTSAHEGSGWTVSSIDVNPDSGVAYPGDWND